MKTAFFFGLFSTLSTSSYILLAVPAAILLVALWPSIQPYVSRLFSGKDNGKGVIVAGESECIAAIRVLIKHGHDRTACEKLWGEIFQHEFPVRP